MEVYHTDNSNFGLGIHIAFSMIVATIVLNITLICHIKFSDQTITHLTMRPYYVSLAQLILLLVEVSLSAYFIFIKYNDNIKSFLDDFTHIKRTPLYSLFTILGLLKNTGILVFSLTRVHENEALLIFIIF